MAFSHGLSFQGDAVGAVHDAIEDRVGQGVVTDDLVPVLDRQLAGDDGGAVCSLMRPSSVFFTSAWGTE